MNYISVKVKDETSHWGTKESKLGAWGKLNLQPPQVTGPKGLQKLETALLTPHHQETEPLLHLRSVWLW